VAGLRNRKIIHKRSQRSRRLGSSEVEPSLGRKIFETFVIFCANPLRSPFSARSSNPELRTSRHLRTRTIDHAVKATRPKRIHAGPNSAEAAYAPVRGNVPASVAGLRNRKIIYRRSQRSRRLGSLEVEPSLSQKIFETFVIFCANPLRPSVNALRTRNFELATTFAPGRSTTRLRPHAQNESNAGPNSAEASSERLRMLQYAATFQLLWRVCATEK
jgi:hypothetical protein